jgi:isoleucyl-tRNA synthetase
VSKETRDAADQRPSYKDTLNLLQTGFGMRANAIKREPELQAALPTPTGLCTWAMP